MLCFSPTGLCGLQVPSSRSVGGVLSSCGEDSWLAWTAKGSEGEIFAGGTCSLESHQPQLGSIGHSAGLLPPGWLRSDIPGSHHLLALSGDKGGAQRCREEEARAGKARTAFLTTGGHIWPLSRALGSPGGWGWWREGSALEPTRRWEAGLSPESHTRLSSWVKGWPYVLLQLNTRVS